MQKKIPISLSLGSNWRTVCNTKGITFSPPYPLYALERLTDKIHSWLVPRAPVGGHIAYMLPASLFILPLPVPCYALPVCVYALRLAGLAYVGCCCGLLGRPSGHSRCLTVFLMFNGTRPFGREPFAWAWIDKLEELCRFAAGRLH